MPVPAWIANSLMRCNIAVGFIHGAFSGLDHTYSVVGIAYRLVEAFIWEVMRVVGIKPAALSAAELIFFPVDSCSIAFRARSFLASAACAIDADIFVFMTAISIPLPLN